MSTIKHTAGARVHVCLRPQETRPDDDWFPGRVLDAHVFPSAPGRPRYVVLLDDGRRLLAHDAQVRSHPPRPWAEAAMAEILDIAS